MKLSEKYSFDLQKYSFDLHEIISNEVRSVAFSSDGKLLVSGSDDGTIRMWDMTSGSCQHTLIGHNDPVRSVCFSPCGTKIVSGGGLEADDGGE